jgi:hypothetical protein
MQLSPHALYGWFNWPRTWQGHGGRDARSPLPKEEEFPHDKYFEFVILINDDPFGKQKLADKFAKFLVSWEPTEVIPR